MFSEPARGVTPCKSGRFEPGGGTHWMLYEYWVVTGGSGCVLTTNSVIIPNDAPAPFNACQSHAGGKTRGHEAEERRTRTKNMSGLSASLARVMVLFASTTSTSRTWSSAEPQRRDRGPRPPIVACPVQGGQLIYVMSRKGHVRKKKVPPIPTWKH